MAASMARHSARTLRVAVFFTPLCGGKREKCGACRRRESSEVVFASSGRHAPGDDATPGIPSNDYGVVYSTNADT
jgi:hypothetical protein